MGSKLLQILTKYLDGEKTSYVNLCLAVKQIHVMSETASLALLGQLEDCIPILDGHFSELIENLLSVTWCMKTEDGVLKERLVEVKARFLVSLAKEHLNYMQNITQNFIRMFYPVLKASEVECGLEVAWEYENSEDMQRKLYRVAHEAIYQLCADFPLITKEFHLWAKAMYPFNNKPTLGYADFTCNLIHMTTYLTGEWGNELREELWSLVVDKLLALDTQYSKRKREEAQKAVEEELANNNTIFDMEVELSPVRKEELRIQALADKLDSILDYVYVFVSTWCSPSSSGGNSEVITVAGEEVFRCLWRAFRHNLLTTYKANNVPFIWLYLSSLNEKYCDKFLSLLWEEVLVPDRGGGAGSFSRRGHAAACYMADFIARAKYIDTDRANHWLKVWADWAKQYLDTTDGAGAREEGCLSHGTFYAVCHAIFFVVGFRYQELLGKGWKTSPIRNLNLDRLTHCSPNPLRYCAYHVVMIFVNVCRRFQIVWCRELLMRNAQKDVFDSDHRKSQVPFESFFPFDPYTLPREYEGLSEDTAGTVEGENAWNKHHQRAKQISISEEKDDFLKDDLLISSYGASPGFRHMEFIEQTGSFPGIKPELDELRSL